MHGRGRCTRRASRACTVPDRASRSPDPAPPEASVGHGVRSGNHVHSRMGQGRMSPAGRPQRMQAIVRVVHGVCTSRRRVPWGGVARAVRSGSSQARSVCAQCSQGSTGHPSPVLARSARTCAARKSPHPRTGVRARPGRVRPKAPALVKRGSGHEPRRVVPQLQQLLDAGRESVGPVVKQRLLGSAQAGAGAPLAPQEHRGDGVQLRG